MNRKTINSGGCYPSVPRTRGDEPYFVATTRAGTTAIWMRHGRGGRSIKPMLMFVKKPEYDQTFNFYKTATKAFNKYFNSEFNKSLEYARRTAR